MDKLIKRSAGHRAALTFALAACALGAAAMARALATTPLEGDSIATAAILGVCLFLAAVAAGRLKAYADSPEGRADGLRQMRAAQVALPLLGALTTIAATTAACVALLPDGGMGLKSLAAEEELAIPIASALTSGIAAGWCVAITEAARARRPFGPNGP